MNILRSDHPARKNLDAIQGAVVSLQAEIHQLERTPLCLDESREFMCQEVARLVERSDPTQGLLRFRSPDQQLPSRRDRLTVTLPDAPTWGMLALILGGADTLLDRLMPSVAKDCASTPGLSQTERTRRLTDLRATLTIKERAEEREVLRLEEEERWTVLRRKDADPKVLLEVWAGRD